MGLALSRTSEGASRLRIEEKLYPEAPNLTKNSRTWGEQRGSTPARVHQQGASARGAVVCLGGEARLCTTRGRREMIEQLWLFHCGMFKVPRNLIVRGERIEMIELPFLAAVAHHQELGPILVDAPFGREGPSNAGEVVGALLQALAVKFRSSWSIVPRLEGMGYRPSEVGHVLMTHLHFDHTGGMKDLAHATFHVSRREWEYATRLRPLEAMLQGYVVGDFRALHTRMALIDSEGGEDGAAEALGEDLELTEGGIDLFGDGSVEAVALPGHSPGHVGFRFQLADGRTAFYLGDAAFDLDQIVRRRMPGKFPLQRARDAERMQATLRALRRYHQDNPEVLLLSAHDRALGERCKGGPAKV